MDSIESIRASAMPVKNTKHQASRGWTQKCCQKYARQAWQPVHSQLWWLEEKYTCRGESLAWGLRMETNLSRSIAALYPVQDQCSALRHTI